MKVSIVIPVYKVEEYIERCLQSVVAQIYDNIEVILVDDASPDFSMSIARRFIDGCSRKEIFRIVTHEQNRGLSAARNSGTKIAEGDYIYYLDSDDEFFDEKSLSKLAANAIETGADVIVGNYMGIRHDSSYESKYSHTILLKDDELINAFVRGDVPIMAWNRLIRRDLFESGLSFKEGILNEDELFSYQLLFMNPSVSLIGDTTYRYYIRPGSIMTTQNYNRLLSPIIVYEETISSYKAIGGNNPVLLRNLDHFAFRRHVSIMSSGFEKERKKELYKRLRQAQKSIRGVGLMRYVYNSHIYFPVSVGYWLMKRIAKKYSATRNLN